MKKKVIKSLFILFLLFIIGGGFALFSLDEINDDLGNLISLHRVEIIRQDLVINVQNVHSNLFTMRTRFGRELNEIVNNVNSLDEAVNKCSGCHHNPSMTKSIKDVQTYVEQYKSALSAYITTRANKARIDRLKKEAVTIGDMILERTIEMAFVANESLQQRTEKAVSKVVVIQKLIVTTLLLFMIIGFVVAAYLTRLITSPLEKLVNAAREVSSGNLGYVTDLRDDTEFGDFASTFDEMSVSLKKSHERIMSYTNRLSMLTKVTVTLYSVSDSDELFREAVSGIKSIIDAEHIDIIILDRERGLCCLVTPEPEEEKVCTNTDRVLELYRRANKKAIIHNTVPDNVPLFSDFKSDYEIRNIIIVWIKQKEECIGALRIANRDYGDFDTEDRRILSIFANNLTVALDNINLYSNLKRKMQELKEAQEQLVQATKLAAIGELASHVAHELNNPLTSILGYTELIKEEEDINRIMDDVIVVEQESLRAREIVRQLLEFSRKRPLDLKETDITSLLNDVLKLTAVSLKSTAITVEENYGDTPAVMVDSNQMKQVFINFINNGIAAMGKKGSLILETGMRDNEIYVSISDTGAGIDRDIIPHIFEPFFTTKEERGTGLGLSVSHKIVTAHGGRINVFSEKGKGSTFIITLPLRKAASHVSP